MTGKEYMIENYCPNDVNLNVCKTCTLTTCKECWNLALEEEVTQEVEEKE